MCIINPWRSLFPFCLQGMWMRQLDCFKQLQWKWATRRKGDRISLIRFFFSVVWKLLLYYQGSLLLLLSAAQWRRLAHFKFTYQAQPPYPCFVWCSSCCHHTVLVQFFAFQVISKFRQAPRSLFIWNSVSPWVSPCGWRHISYACSVSVNTFVNFLPNILRQ